MLRIIIFICGREDIASLGDFYGYLADVWQVFDENAGLR